LTDIEFKKGIKPLDVNIKVITQWQELVNSIAKLLEIPAALIMRLNGTKIEVYRTSDTSGNPYKLYDAEHFFESGLYCETVIRTDDKLYVENALEDEHWKNNPDVKLDMISYLGFPIKNADETPFGTLCILDHKPRQWSADQENVLINFRDMIESHLELLAKTKELKRVNRTLENHLELLHKTNEIAEMNKSLEKMAYYDRLTNVYNRLYFFEIAETLNIFAKKEKTLSSIIMLDIDNFKILNNTYGHSFGDTLLKSLCEEIKFIIRDDDVFARFGGGEFILFLPNTNETTSLMLSEKIRNKIEKTPVEGIKYTISLGITKHDAQTSSIADSIKLADKALLDAKNNGKNQVSRI